MVIYLDIMFVENFLINLILLISVNIIRKEKTKMIRIINSSGIGAIASIYFIVVSIEENIGIVIKIVLSVVMVLVGYNTKKFKEFKQKIFDFYLVSFLFAGIAYFWIESGNEKQTNFIQMVVVTSLSGLIILTKVFKIRKSKIDKKKIMYQIKMDYKGSKIQTTAILDTGNLLKEPISQKPVIVCEVDVFRGVLEDILLDNLDNVMGGELNYELEKAVAKHQDRIKLIPYSSLGKSQGLLLGVSLDKVCVNIKDKKIENDMVVAGLYKGQYEKEGKYHALMGLDLIEGGS